MTRYHPVRLTGCEPDPPPAELVADIRRWITSEPMRDLVRLAGATLPDLPTVDLLAWLDEFSAEHWDRRAGRERHEATEPELASDARRLVLAAATALGLVRTPPPRYDDYTHLVVLGGLARACLQRTGYAGQLLRAGRLGTPEVGALGSFRELDQKEKQLLAARGLTGQRHEMDALDAGARRFLDLDQPADERSHADPASPHRSWSVRSYRSGTGTTVRVLAAPSTDHTRRADTVDTQNFWADQVTLTPRNRVLLVTSAIYTPFQHVDAIRTLGVRYRCGVDTVGVEADWGDDPLLHQPVSPGRYLQEIRSGIRSMRRLLWTLSRDT